MKATIMILFLFFATGAVWGQKTPKTQTVVIHTSAECGQCEERLEKGLNYTKGVVFAELDLETQNVTIKYNAKKTDVPALKKVINNLGYDADEQKADPKALEALPACCKPGGMEKSGPPAHH